ncbi:hypothetical protein C1H69_06440 [Billgrantia endophytica]|uniref:Uncharacterized protein n=1 Tax=Billgrantia endophytica TaxID=2033802 RepID=A0A2N7U8A0_9GAMM|nr:hypothetical protein C1H69_06440 [Halomonas endophytica]
MQFPSVQFFVRAWRHDHHLARFVRQPAGPSCQPPSGRLHLDSVPDQETIILSKEYAQWMSANGRFRLFIALQKL